MNATETVGDLDALSKRLATFIEEGALFAPFRLALDGGVIDLAQDIYPTSIHRECSACGHLTTWTRFEPHALADTTPRAKRVPPQSAGGDVLQYRCASCSEQLFGVWIRRDGVREHSATLGGVGGISRWETSRTRLATFTKVGQSEPPDVRVPSLLAKTMTEEDRRLYARALTCAAHGFGLGALAYMRRVVENERSRLLDLRETEATEANDQAMLARISAAKSARSEQERMRLLSEIDQEATNLVGQAPMGLLFGKCSDGVHNLSEEECLNLAGEIRDLFEVVLERLEQQKKHREVLKRAGRARP
jgi:hypothetical protein